MVGYCLSMAAGIDLHMAAWLAITRASVIGFILSLSARKSELSVGPRAVVGAGQRCAILTACGCPDAGP